jgi:asparagine synthase (glutamine-hydrolysing)
MCGLTGFIDLRNRLSADQLNSIVTDMAEAIRHRGPDDQGVWVEPESGIAFGHRRLSILDLSAHGHQPMVSRDGRYVLIYNGEIYNHLDIRKDLSGPFVGHSDTETLLEAIAAWGIEKALAHCNGMFAFAVWDRKTRTLSLARDRLGVKPLYWGLNEDAFFFGSELKSLKELPLWTCEMDPEALQQYLRYTYVPTPYSIYKNVYKLRPGHYMTYEIGQEPEFTCYWSAQEQMLMGQSASPTSTDEATDALEALLKDSIKLRMLSDVPIGAFLSGGVDSSTVVALMQAQSTKPVKTFTIGFEHGAYNEAEQARAVAKHLGTDHTEMYVSPQQAMSIIPVLSTYYDEPFADSSQIPTLLVSQLARQQVTVALSGDGGDEAFLGYNRYQATSSYLNKLLSIPGPLRSVLRGSIRLISPARWDLLGGLIPESRRPRLLGDKLYKLANTMGSNTRDQMYLSLVSCFQAPSSVLSNPLPEPTYHLDTRAKDFTQACQLADILGYLPDDILTKVDRATMAVSLEGRDPLLDYRILEFAWGLPDDLKLRNGTSKWLLRQVLYRYVPKELIERPKMGFSVPIDKWLLGPLRDWADSRISSLYLDDMLKTSEIKKLWHEHLSGQYNHQHQLWTLLMYQQWRSHN